MENMEMILLQKPLTSSLRRIYFKWKGYKKTPLLKWGRKVIFLFKIK